MIQVEARPAPSTETTLPGLYRQRYFHTLDGLRALSITLVIGMHIVMSYKLPFSLHAYANLGVQFFFVISGFLITTLLLKEQVSTGSISLKNFYIRRAYRILPVAFLYLLFVVVVKFVFKLNLAPVYIITSFLFLRNYFKNSTGIDHLTTHYWSLSVEEQFYLIFPAILKKSSKLYIAFLIFMVVAGLVAEPIIRAIPSFRATALGGIFSIFFTSFTGISIGALTSILTFKRWIAIPETVRFRDAKITVLFLSIFVITGFEIPADTLFKGVLFAIALVLLLSRPDSKGSYFKVFNHPKIKYIGLLSYSLYIWQQPLTLNLTYLNKLKIFSGIANKALLDISISIVCLVALFVISYLSYNYYEKIFLRIKNRFKTLPH